MVALVPRPAKRCGKALFLKERRDQFYRRVFRCEGQAGASARRPGGGVAYADVMFVTTGFGEVLALNVADGGIIWRVQNNVGFSNAPTVRNGCVYVAQTAGCRLSADDGARLWSIWRLTNRRPLWAPPALP